MLGHSKGLLLRIFIGESDSWKRKPLYEAIILRAREKGLAGCTVTRAISGYGANSRIRSAKVQRLSMDLPIVLEIVDEPDKIEAFLPEVDELVKDGLVIIQPVDIRLYRSRE
jgi:PII-like signaling protein